MNNNFNYEYIQLNVKKQSDGDSYRHRFCTSSGIRTLDPLIKSQLLYQLSYGDFFSLFEAAKIHFFYIFAKKIR